MSIQTFAPSRPFIGPDRATVSRLSAIAAAVIFGMAGLILFAVGISFPIAVGAITEQGLPFSAADIALAERLAPMWWLFISASVLNVVALVAVLDRGSLGKRIAVVVAGTGLGLAVAAQLVLVIRGASNGVPADVTNVIATIYLVALVCAVLVQLRSR
jgi:hypothetical protein